jgi:small nuclear ribonucleoprotein (snRNP)-like protein
MPYKTISEKKMDNTSDENLFVKELKKLKGKPISLCQSNKEIKKGNLLAVDNRLNIVLEKDDGNIELIRGSKITYVIIPE